MSFLFYEILEMEGHSSLVENIESARQDWTVLIQN